MKKFMAAVLSLSLTAGLCACGGGAASPSNTDAPVNPETPAAPAATAEVETAAKTPPAPAATAEAETAAETPAAAENPTGETVEVQVNLPEDHGMAGIYKWIEMTDYGLETYLILWDDGIGSIDIVGTGTVRGVFYNDETMQVADEGTVPQKYAYADDKLLWTYTDEQGEHSSTFVRLTPEERAAYEALGVGSVAETGDGNNEGNPSPFPEDHGGLAGVYKWVEMANLDLNAYLLLWDGGIGAIDMAGADKLIAVLYDEETMQSTDEGAVPQNYTYADGRLVWTYTDEAGEHVSTFVKLTAEELAEYQAKGIGNLE